MKRLVFVVLIALALPALADEVSWELATEREDGMALAPAEIAGHYVFFSDGTAGVYPNQVWIPMPNTFSEVPNARYERHAVVVTVDTDGLDSVYSAMVTIPKLVFAPPKPPGNVRISQPSQPDAN